MWSIRRVTGKMSGVRWILRFSEWQPTAAEWMEACSRIQPEEIAQVNGFVFKKDAKATLIGRLLTRDFLTKALNIPNNSLLMGRTDKGKPYVLDPPSAEHGWSFNLSHSGDYVVFGAERGCLLGIDVMRTDYPSRKSLQDYFQLMKSQFTPREWTLITSAPSESDQLRNFYRLWCLKESYVKALGIGIGYSVSQLDFHLPPAPAPITLDIAGVRQSDWIFREFCIGEQHVGAVALQAPPGVLENRAEPTLISREIEEVIAGLAPLHKVNEEVGKRFIGKAERPESVGIHQKRSM